MIPRKCTLAAAALGLVCKIYGQEVVEAGIAPGVTNVYSLPLAGYVNNGTIGRAFSPSQDITISSLGWLAVGANPPPAGMSIGLWSTDGTLLRSTGIGIIGKRV